VERRLQGTAVAPMLITLAGEQAITEQESRAYESAALSRTPSMRGQQLPDLGGVVNDQHSLRSHPQRDSRGAAGHQHVEKIHRRAAERTHQCRVHLQRPRRSGDKLSHAHRSKLLAADQPVLDGAVRLPPIRLLIILTPIKALDALRIR
jgi:hypothetical protein